MTQFRHKTGRLSSLRWLFIGVLCIGSLWGCGLEESEAPETSGTPEGDSTDDTASTGDIDTGGTEATFDEIGGSDGGGTSEPPGSSSGSDDIQSGVLTAGDIDDNLNFDTFSEFLNGQMQSTLGEDFPALSIQPRIEVQVVNDSGEAVSLANVQILDDQNGLLLERQTDTLGRFYFFPHADLRDEVRDHITQVSIRVGHPSTLDTSTSELLDIASQSIQLTLPISDSTLPNELEWMLVLDATGSMGDELDYLTTEFAAIISDVAADHPGVAIRLGLIAYRDEGDAFVVREYPFTDSISTMVAQLEGLSAAGGGDYPEAMDQALEAAMQYDWGTGTEARVITLVADAPPHDEQIEATLNAGFEAREKGIQLMSLAASGVATKAEIIMRTMAVLTHSSYIFLTDDSGVGNSHAEPSIPCYQVTRLDQLIARQLSSILSGERIEPEEDAIIRTSGQYDQGVCLIEEEPQDSGGSH